MAPTSFQFSPSINPRYTYTNVIGVIAKNVYKQKTHTFILAIPHGMEISVLTPGMNLLAECDESAMLFKESIRFIKRLRFYKKYFPYLFKKGLPP